MIFPSEGEREREGERGRERRDIYCVYVHIYCAPTKTPSPRLGTVEQWPPACSCPTEGGARVMCLTCDLHETSYLAIANVLVVDTVCNQYVLQLTRLQEKT